MTKLYYYLGLCLCLSLFAGGFLSCTPTNRTKKVLVFSKTDGYRHKSIEAGQKALFLMGSQNGFAVDTTESSEAFVEENLKKYSAVIFLNTTKDVLDFRQQKDFERYIQAGGGFVGIHAAADTEYNWPWYGKLVGAYFKSHPNNPNVLEGTMKVVNHDHISTAFLKGKTDWVRTDEFYNFKDIYTGESDGIVPLIEVDETTYKGGENGEFHPMSWYHEFDGGRAFYTNFGHTDETFLEPDFLTHLKGGIDYAIGKNLALNYAKARTQRAPEENRFVKTVLAENLNEPGELEILKDGKILFTERRGNLQLFDPAAQSVRTIATLDVYDDKEDGLVGISLDPNYYENHYIYLYYSPPTKEPIFRLSRFILKDEVLDKESEKIMLVVDVQRDECCHTGGSIQFDTDGNLFLSTGDDTNPFETGYGPINELPGRSAWDAQKSSANTQDLRGKILRIKPTPEGGYTIPEGNLFPKDGSKGRPEIYVMGCRNPYRISIDPKTKYLYWGDVGPDAQKDSTRGPRGHDEINQARKPGFFGWPLFVGDNKPYRDVDFSDNSYRDFFDPAAPVNNSPNNTGIQNLPPAQKAFIWYPYAESPEFPIVGKGGRNAMAGPVYYHDLFEGAKSQFPKYYDGKLFIYDFSRDWVLVVTMDEQGNLQEIEPFLSGLNLSSPMDMTFGPDGALYLLEYGTRWFARNQDARLIRIDYAENNRAPIAIAEASIREGAVPLEIDFSAKESYDHDDDEQLSYSWKFAEGQTATGETTRHTFTKAGIYPVVLTATDKEGKSSSATVQIKVGNERPKVSLGFSGNRSFFFGNTPFVYNVNIEDKEDGSLADGKIPAEQVALTINFLDQSEDKTLQAQGHAAQAASANIATGKELIAKLGCIACHDLDNTVLGPPYRKVAVRYKNQADAQSYLVNKVINGSMGVWGGQAMPAQMQVKEEQAHQMIQYVLSLASEKAAGPALPLSGSYPLNKHTGDGANASYLIEASYQDKGGEPVGSLLGVETLTLRSPKIMGTNTDLGKSNKVRFRDTFVQMEPEGYMYFANIDLGQLSGAKVTYRSRKGSGTLELRLDAPDGPVVATWNLDAEAKPRKTAYTKLQAEGFHDLYFVAKQGANAFTDNAGLFQVESIEFEN